MIHLHAHMDVHESLDTTFVPQGHFLNRIHVDVPYSSLVEYSSLAVRSSQWFTYHLSVFVDMSSIVYCHCFMYTCSLVPHAMYGISFINCSPTFIGAQSTQSWPHLPSYSSVSGLCFSCCELARQSNSCQRLTHQQVNTDIISDLC